MRTRGSGGWQGPGVVTAYMFKENWGTLGHCLSFRQDSHVSCFPGSYSLVERRQCDISLFSDSFAPRSRHCAENHRRAGGRTVWCWDLEADSGKSVPGKTPSLVLVLSNQRQQLGQNMARRERKRDEGKRKRGKDKIGGYNYSLLY